MRWVATQLGPDEEALLAGWPETLRLGSGSGDVLFCHATPRNDTEIFTRLTPEDRLLPLFERLGVPLVVCGHTHMQFDRTIGTTRVLNAGSVGMPFGEPGRLLAAARDPAWSSGRRTTIWRAADRIRARGIRMPPISPRATSCSLPQKLKL